MPDPALTLTVVGCGPAWTNPGEAGAKATNGIDDDGNGYIDDVHGWDFCNDDASVHDAGMDGHGTHVAGTIAAALDGTGTVGVAPGVRIMALKFIDDSGTCGTDDQAVAAIDIAAAAHILLTVEEQVVSADEGRVVSEHLRRHRLAVQALLKVGEGAGRAVGAGGAADQQLAVDDAGKVDRVENIGKGA